MGPCVRYAVVFLGSVIGAGFASGREIVSFFSSYGALSWLLILLSAFVMAGLCRLCLRCAGRAKGCRWCSIYANNSSGVRNAAQGCILLLQVLLGGSMLSAAGHAAALCLPLRNAYGIGVLVTIVLAVLLGCVSLRPMTLLGGVLAFLFGVAVLALLIFDCGEQAVPVVCPLNGVQAVEGVLRAVAYAALNLTVSIGAVCRCSGCSCRVQSRSVVLFGFGMAGLLLVSNYLYLKHPELNGSTFPMVSLLSQFGKVGYITALVLMYLAILTTLAAGLFALRIGLEEHLSSPVALLLTALLPIAVSCAGFESIVDSWYAPAGLLCLLLVFVPLVGWRTKIS